MKELSIREIFSEGWRYTKEHLWFLIGYLLIMIIVELAFAFISGAYEEQEKLLVSAVTSLIGMIVVLFMQMGFYNSALMITSWMKPTFEQLYSNGRNAVSWFVGNILFSLIVFVGFLLLIVPGIYFMARYALFPFFILDRNLGPIEALEAASKASKGHCWFIFLFGLCAFLVNIAGALLAVVGLLITIPLTLMAFTVLYRKLTSVQEIQEIQEIEEI